VWVLGIETAGERGGVALWRADGPAHEVAFRAGRVHVELLAPSVESVLGLASIAPGDLSLVCVDVGPGSFTGLRIGLAFAHGLAGSVDIPVVGVRQAEALGLTAARWWSGKVVVWIHDRDDVLYVSWISGRRAGAEAVLRAEEAVAKLHDRREVLVVGTGAVRYAAELEARAPGVRPGGAVWEYPSALEVARLGHARWRDGAGKRECVEPWYVQGPID